MGVSIIMPFRNSERWIENAINSIQDQTHSDWELLAVNDHSTDSSSEIVFRLSRKDPRIRFFQNEGKGIIPALQTALSHVQKDFITRLDSDDIMPASRLTEMTRKLKSLGRGNLVAGKVRYFSDQPVSEGYLKYAEWLNERVDKEDFFEWRFRECVIASPAWLMYTEDLVSTGGFDQLTYPEDYHLVLRWLYAGVEFRSIPETVLHWREHPDRTSRNHEGFRQKAFFELKLSYLLNNEYHSHQRINLLTSGTPKTKLLTSYFEARNISVQRFDSKTVQDLPDAGNDLLLSAVFPGLAKRKRLEELTEQRGYKHGVNFFYL